MRPVSDVWRAEKVLMGQPGLEQQGAVVLADLQRAGLPCPRDLVSVLAISSWRGTLQWNRVEGDATGETPRSHLPAALRGSQVLLNVLRE